MAFSDLRMDPEPEMGLEIMPCQMCVSEGEAGEAWADGDDWGRPNVRCLTCNDWGRPADHHENYEDGYRAAIKMWNRQQTLIARGLLMESSAGEGSGKGRL